jgi:AcrR family transcriptional regulator
MTDSTTKSPTAAASPDVWGGSLSAHRARQAEHIAHVAMGIIATDGIAGLSMSALAEGAGISRQTLYKYFPDIDAVLAALATVGSAGIDELAARIEAQAGPRLGLRLFVAAMVESAAAGHPSPAALTAALPADARAAMREHEMEAEQLVVKLLRRGRDEGSFRADLDPELDGLIVYRAILAAHELVAGEGVELERLSEHLSDDMLRIVEAETRPRRRSR